MSSSSVDGLVSGLSTASLINQLLQVEAAPQERLKAKVSTAQTAVSSYQAVNSRVAAFQTAADTLGKLSTWRGIKATSTSPNVTATAVPGSTDTAAGTTTFDVAALAKSQITTAKVHPSAAVTTADTITITIGPADAGGVDNSSKRKDYVIDVSKDKSAKGVMNAINAKGIGVKATVVTTGGAQNILQFSGTRTGLSNAFTISNFDPPTTSVAQAQNALLKIGGGEDQGGYNVVSETNTFSGLLAGVTVTVAKEEQNVTVEATQDLDGIAEKFQALVDTANAALDEIKSQTAYDSATNKSSPLTGDFSVRNMAQTILSSISKGLTYPDPESTEQNPLPDIKFGSLSQLGIKLHESGKLDEFNKGQFIKAYNADPAGIQQAATAFAEQIEKLAETQTKSLKSVMTGRKDEINGYNNQIRNWDVRLAAKRVALQKQYSDLEVSLGKLKNQSNWLSGQLSGLG